MAMDVVILTGTADASGDLTVNHTTTVLGYLYMVEVIDGTFDDGVDWTISVQGVAGGAAATTLLTLTDSNNDARFYPRVAVHGPTGTALTATAGGDNVMPLVAGVPRLVVASGGNAGAGGVVLYIVRA